MLGLACCLVAAGQSPEDLPAFDVASLKPNMAALPDYIETGSSKHGAVTLHNANMQDCLRYAYGLVSNDQIAGPGWMADYTVRFDIVGKAPPETPPERLLLMLQRLLAERFHLVLHQQSKPIPHLDLQLGKGAPRLPASPEEPAAPKYVFGRGLLNYSHSTMGELAMLLSRQLKRPVFNRTRLAGFYDINLQWRPDDPQAIPPDPNAVVPPPPVDDSRPELSDALAKLGLELTTSKAPITLLVVDRIDRVPVGN
jgi:uncharacterized protein (TIGR03435 family)